MLFKLEYDENGKKVLCEMNGINSEMLMDIYVKKLKKGETLEIIEENNECAILLLSGDVTFKVGNEIGERCKRKNPFEKKPYAVHFCKQVKASVTANEESEILVQMTDNEKTWKSEFYNPDNCLYQEFGKGQWNGTGHRIVSTMFDLDNAPQFDHPEGFGAGFEGNTPYKTENGSCLCIRGGNAHQQVTAPGYEMYYVWLIRHLDGDPWDKTRIYVPEYEWLANSD